MRRYPSGVTGAEWAAVRPLLPVPAWLEGRGGQPEGCHRQMLDAIRYLVAGGISWRAMPVDFSDWGRVYAFFRRWREYGLIAEFHNRLRGRVREREGSEAEPTAGIIDAQSVNAAATVPAEHIGNPSSGSPRTTRHLRAACRSHLAPCELASRVPTPGTPLLLPQADFGQDRRVQRARNPGRYRRVQRACNPGHLCPPERQICPIYPSRGSDPACRRALRSAPQSVG
ncbi:transposase [Streptomyces sp. NPDC002928]|uniref:transposase n=1 Tax=Streptomyces sp. NPDC002928 TaxID=3154440 RepID=UPI0033B0F5BC